MSERGKVPNSKPTNGLYTFKPYVYRGNKHDTMVPWPSTKPNPKRCADCGYVLTGKKHKAVCG